MPTDPNTVYFGLGSNLGSRRENLQRAIVRLTAEGVPVRRVSTLYLSEPVGVPGGDFINAVAEASTSLGPDELLTRCRAVEEALGRTSRGDLQPRTIDIDILLYGTLRLQTPALTIPHPRLHLRRFVLAPLAEIAPGVVVPGIERTVRDLLSRCPDSSRVEPIHG